MAASDILPHILSEALCHTRKAVQNFRQGDPGICTVNGRLSGTWFPVLFTIGVVVVTLISAAAALVSLYDT